MAILHGSWIAQPQTTPSDLAQKTFLQNPAGMGPEGHFLIWGETWRRIDPVPVLAADQLLPHPFAMSAAELTEFLRSLHQSQQLRWQLETPDPQEQKLAIALPTANIPSDDSDGSLVLMPQHSAAGWNQDSPSDTQNSRKSPVLELRNWQIEGICLQPATAIQFLNAIPLGSFHQEDSYVGRDLRYWTHIARWGLDLWARAKFLPRLEYRSNNEAIAFWQVLIDSATDQERFEHFAHRMPAACRAYQPSEHLSSATVLFAPEASSHPNPTGQDSHVASPSEPSPPPDSPEGDRSSEPGSSPAEVAAPPQFGSAVPIAEPKSLLLSFLNTLTDAQIRSIMATHTLPATQFPKELPLRQWLQALGTQPTFSAESTQSERLEAALSGWTAPLQHQIAQQTAAFRTCFYLHPPEGHAKPLNWTLEYFLQANNDPQFLLSAQEIWSNPVEQLSHQGRTIVRPQETLLAGLGSASRLYPLLEPSLHVQHPQACRLDPMQAYEFIKSTAWRLQDSGFGVVLPPSLSQQGGVANRLGLEVRAQTPTRKKQQLGLQSLLNFKWELSIGGQRISKAEFDRLAALNTPLVEINGEWVELRSQDVKAAQAFFENRKDQMSLSLEDAIRMATGDTQMIEKLPVVNFEASGPLEELLNTLTTGNQSVEVLPTPKGFRGELRPYQKRGTAWLAFLEQWGLGACLADDMGLGKTIQLIALLLHLQEQNGLEHPTLLICPTSVLGNWEREVRRFGPSLKVIVHHGDKRPQGKAFAKAVKDQHLVITSYALTYRDAKDLQSITWQGVVLDEAQNIKNPEAKQSQAVRQLNNQFRIALTGTPVENRLSELWSILDFLNPGYLGPRNFFQRRFAMPIERYGDTASLQTLRSLVQPFILRRLKTDRNIIQDLPDKQEMTVFCGLAAQQATLYQQLVDQSLAAIESSEGIQRRGMILALLVKLKQVCNHPILLKDEKATSEPKAKGKKQKSNPSAQLHASFPAHSGKLQRLEEMLEELLAEGDRALIFTQFSEWGKLLKPHLEKRFGREVLFLYGGTSKKQREEMVDRFQNDPQAPRIFILSLKAGGVGLNLTRANHVFHFDRWWNPAVENQATDRVFRIGQTRNVQVHKFVCTGTLEERIHELIESKRALSEQIVGSGENWLTDFDTEQLRNLLLLDRSAIIDEES